MIIVIGNTKGGVGKTTIAVNLAIGLAGRGQDLLLVDGDEQATALAFTELRSAHHPDTYTAVALHGAAIRTQARQLRNRYDQIVVDVGGRDNVSLRAALTVADVILIPAQPRSFDLWGVDHTKDLIDEAREVNDHLQAFAILNAADPAGQDNFEAARALGELKGIEVLPFHLVRRKAYPNSAAQGLGVLEYTDPSNREGSHKASIEFGTLLTFVHGIHCIERMGR